MIAVVHVLAGAVVGMAFDSLPAIFIVSLFLHYLMDLLPHIDTETFVKRRLSYTWRETFTVAADALTALLIGGIFFFLHQRWQYVLTGAVASLLPDLLMPLERYRAFYPLRRFHYMFHWDRNRAREWSWYVAGIVTPTVFALLSTAILWWGA